MVARASIRRVGVDGLAIVDEAPIRRRDPAPLRAGHSERSTRSVNCRSSSRVRRGRTSARARASWYARTASAELRLATQHRAQQVDQVELGLPRAPAPVRPKSATRAPWRHAPDAATSKVSRCSPRHRHRPPRPASRSVSGELEQGICAVIAKLPEEHRTLRLRDTRESAHDRVVDERGHLLRLQAARRVGIEYFQEVPHPDRRCLLAERGIRLQRDQVRLEVVVEGDRIEHQVAERQSPPGPRSGNGGTAWPRIRLRARPTRRWCHWHG